jgi:hypothetical protein
MEKRTYTLLAVLLTLYFYAPDCFAATAKTCCGPCTFRCGDRVDFVGSTTSLIKPYHSDKHPKSLNTRATAITIGQSDISSLMVAGRSEKAYNSNAGASFTMNIGSANSSTAQNWTLPANILSSMSLFYNRTFIDMAAVTPEAAKVSGATHVYKETFTEDGESYINYHFFNLDGDNLEDWGQNHVKVSTGEVIRNDGEAPEQYTDSPLELGDAFDSHNEFYDMNNMGTDTYNDASVLMDAFGTIETPFGTFECLRGFITENTTPYDANTGTPSSAASTTYYVFWVTKEGFRFYAEVSPLASGSVTVSNFNLHYVSNSSALPVELLTFAGQATAQGNLLTWTTANETNNKGFEIERSYDGKTFEKIGFVKGNGTSSVQQTYSFTDNTPLSKTTYYRLQQVDFDGSKAFSNTISIEPQVFNKGLKVYPNPSSDGQIFVEIPQNTEGGILVMNSVGQIVFQQKSISNPIFKMDVSNWIKGVYFIKSGNEVVKFVIY